MLGQAICDLTHQLIKEWGIPLSKVHFITDNGSNMVKAFKLAQVAAMNESEDTGSPEEESSREDDEEGDEQEEEEEEEEEEDYDDDAFENMNDEEVAEFDEEEANHTSAFARQGFKRLGCFSHTLQLVVATFNQDPSAKKLLSKVYKVVKQVSKSGKATEALHTQKL